MNKLLSAIVASLALIFATNQPAHAWCKYNFGIGMNIGYEGGGNSILFGLLSGANTPGHHDGGYPVPAGVDYGPMPNNHPPSAAPQGPEKLPAPMPVKPAAYTPYPYVGYYYAAYPVMPLYQTYSGYSYYPFYAGYYYGQ